MLLCRACLLFLIAIILLILPCKYIDFLQTSNLSAAIFDSNNKIEVAIFPFRNNTDTPKLQESIPDLLRGELFKTGIFAIVESKSLYRTIWRISISDLIKIENAGVISSDRFLEQNVDLFARLKKDEIKRVFDFIDADYSIIGVANQFGNIIRVEVEILDVYSKQTIGITSFEINDIEKMPEAVSDTVFEIKELTIKKNIKEIANYIVGNYRAGVITFEKTVSNLKEVALMAPESIYANTQLLSLYIEEGHNNEVIGICKSIVSNVLQSDENILNIFAHFGVDPFEVLGNFYNNDNHLEEAVDIYTRAIKGVPLNKAKYYKSLGEVFVRQGKLSDAIEALNHSIEFNQRDFEAHYKLGMVYELGNYDLEALKEYKLCLKYAGGHLNDLEIESVKRKIIALEEWDQ